MFGHCTALNCTLTAAADINKMRCFCTDVFGCKGGTNRAPVPEDDANADGINLDANADQDAIVLPSDDEGAIVIPSDDAGVASMMALVEVLPIDLIIKKPASVVRLVVRMNGCARQPKSSLSIHFGLGAQRLTAGVGDG